MQNTKMFLLFHLWNHFRANLATLSWFDMPLRNISGPDIESQTQMTQEPSLQDSAFSESRKRSNSGIKFHRAEDAKITDFSGQSILLILAITDTLMDGPWFPLMHACTIESNGLAG